jgi:hypothetical protein
VNKIKVNITLHCAPIVPFRQYIANRVSQ